MQDSRDQTLLFPLTSRLFIFLFEVYTWLRVQELFRVELCELYVAPGLVFEFDTLTPIQFLQLNICVYMYIIYNEYYTFPLVVKNLGFSVPRVSGIYF